MVGQVHRHLNVVATNLDIWWAKPQDFVALRNADPYQLHVAASLRHPKRLRFGWQRPRPEPPLAVGCPAAYLPSSQRLVAIYLHQARTTDMLAMAHALVESCLLQAPQLTWVTALPKEAPRRPILPIFALHSARQNQADFEAAHVATLGAAQIIARSQDPQALSPQFLQKRWLIPAAKLAALSQSPRGLGYAPHGGVLHAAENNFPVLEPSPQFGNWAHPRANWPSSRAAPAATVQARPSIWR